MSNTSAVKTAPIERVSAERTWKDTTAYAILKQFFRNKTAVLGLIILLFMIVISIAAPMLTSYDYAKIDPINANQTPSAAHILGTDFYGRDMLARLLYGGRYSLTLAFSAELVGLLVGVILGAVAGYFGGIVDTLILRFCDVLQSIPSTLLAICISQTIGGGFIPTIIALSFGGMPVMVRLLRGQMLNVRKQEFVEAAQVVNCKKGRIIFKHVVPNCMASLIVTASMGIGGKILTSAGLSFLGLGIQEPLPEWGAMIALGRSQLRYYPHLIIIPGLFVAVTVLAFNMVGDGLRDALDPKQRS